MTNHFAPFIQILGKGKKGSRALSQDEALTAMGFILDGKVSDLQLGAFLMLLRVKEETGEELAGFAQAIRNRLPKNSIDVDIDWPSYAGKRRQLPWYLLAALALANAGHRIVMHGHHGHTAGRLYSEDVLKTLGLPIAKDTNDVEQHLNQRNFSFYPLRHWQSKLSDIINLKSEFALRSPVHSLVRLVNPFDAKLTLQGVFHPAYNGIHQQAACILDFCSIIARGEGGEFERNPEMALSAFSVSKQKETDLVADKWLKSRIVKPETLNVDVLKSHWRGTNNAYGEAAVLSTISLILVGMEPELTEDQRVLKATEIWQNRQLDMI